MGILFGSSRNAEAETTLRPTNSGRIQDKMRIVVSRFSENITINDTWLLSYDHLIMNRGLDNLPLQFTSQLLYENVGRESFVYLQYIIQNYDSLNSYTIFVQADWLGELDFQLVCFIFLLSKTTRLISFCFTGCSNHHEKSDL